MSHRGMMIAGAACTLAGLIVLGIGLYAVSGGFAATTWEIVGRVMSPSEWGWYLSIVGVVVLLIGATVTYSGFGKKPPSRALVEYVRGSEHDTWHWCRNCTQYPLYVYERSADRPHSNLCQQCKAKEDNEDCITEPDTEPADRLVHALGP